MPAINLRDHPKLRGKWPPDWHPNNPIASHNKTGPQGEQGTLKEVRRYWHGSSGHLALIVRYEGESYHGQVELEDEFFCQNLLNALATCIGRSIQDIGNINLAF